MNDYRRSTFIYLASKPDAVGCSFNSASDTASISQGIAQLVELNPGLPYHSSTLVTHTSQIHLLTPRFGYLSTIIIKCIFCEIVH